MYTVLMPSGNFLEGSFSFAFDMSNQVFGSSDASVLPGSLTFPADVLLTPANRAELGFPDLVTKPGRFREFEGVWVYCHGQPMFYGTLLIRRANPTKASVNIIANPMRRLKDINLNELDLGGERDLGSAATWLDLMYDTITAPDDHDFVFVPMYNVERNDYVFSFDDPDASHRPFFNEYDPFSGGQFQAASGALVPFPKLLYVLQQLFAAEDTGYTFANLWQVTLELQRLYVFNNWDMRTLNADQLPDYPETINLTNHVPKLKGTEILKKTMAHFCLGLFSNIFTREIRLIPRATLLRRAPKHDWTQYVVSENDLQPTDDAPGIFNYEQPDKLPFDVPAPEGLPSFNVLRDFNDAVIAGLADGFYYIEGEHMIVQYKSGPTYFVPHAAWLQHRGVVLDASRERYDTGLTSLLHYTSDAYYNSPVVASRFYETTNNLDETVWERRVTDPPVALFAYRGMNNLGDPFAFPVASNHVWDPSEGGGERLAITPAPEATSAERSLNWSGEYGLYETAHKAWANMLLFAKPVELVLALPVATLTAFSFEDKVRILNMDYFVRRLRVGKPLGGGLVEVQATLLSII